MRFCTPTTGGPHEVLHPHDGATTGGTTARGGQICELQVTLIDVDLPVWRRIAVLRDLTVADLHPVIQAVMGWSDVHLHQFVTADGARYEATNPERDPDGPEPGVRDARGVRLPEVLPEPGAALGYTYDFGDGREHRVEVLAARPTLGSNPRSAWPESGPVLWCLKTPCPSSGVRVDGPRIES